MIGKIGIGWRQGEREGTIEAQVVYSRLGDTTIFNDSTEFDEKWKS